MQVFISHKIEGDAEFGIQLQKSLAKEDIFGYIAELKQEYDILISEKIKGEIYKSKYLITIITEHSLNSASVHEEIGYAIGKDIPVLLMIEESDQPAAESPKRVPDRQTIQPTFVLGGRYSITGCYVNPSHHAKTTRHGMVGRYLCCLTFKKGGGLWTDFTPGFNCTP